MKTEEKILTAVVSRKLLSETGYWMLPACRRQGCWILDVWVWVA